MTEQTNTGSPGSHPHSDRPNWQPGDDDADELLRQKIADALRDGKSERHLAKLLGLSRMALWRAKLFIAIPRGLFERLTEAGIGMKALIYIGRWCRDPDNGCGSEVERCPHCGGLLRVRGNKQIPQALDILNKWIEDGKPGPTDDINPGGGGNDCG